VLGWAVGSVKRHSKITMLTDLYEGLNLHVHGLPKFMRHMNPDKMSTSQRDVIVSF
jgi:hypothetical protein